jgi:hypothetical protein
MDELEFMYEDLETIRSDLSNEDGYSKLDLIQVLHFKEYFKKLSSD